MRRVWYLLFLSWILLAGDPWTTKEVLRPDQLVPNLKTPLLIHVGFPVLYRSVHIVGSLYAGPGSKGEGIEQLKNLLETQSRDREIVLYCGCCPWDKCPNIRPAYAALHELGFTHVKVLMIPENLKTDWIDKRYPTDKR